MSGRNGCQTLCQIFQQIVRILDAAGKAQSAAGDTEFRPCLVCEVLVRRGAGMGDEALGVAQIVGNLHDLKRVLQLEGRFLAALQFESHQRRTTGHLPCNDVGLRVIGAPGIDDLGDLAAIGKEVRDLRGIGRLLLHAQRQRLDALQKRPGIERRHGRAGVAEIILQLFLNPFLVGKDHAAEAATLAVNMFGGRINDDMGAEFERFLEKRCGEDIVNDHFRTDLVGKLRYAGDIHHFECRIGWAFEEKQLGVWLDCLFPVAKITSVDQRAFDAIFRRERFNHPAAGAEEGTGGNDMVAGAQLTHDGGGDGGHARSKCAGVFSAFQQAHALFEHVIGRTGVAGVNKAVGFTLEARFGCFRVFVDETLGQINRFRRFTVRGA